MKVNKLAQNINFAAQFSKKFESILKNQARDVFSDDEVSEKVKQDLENHIRAMQACFPTALLDVRQRDVLSEDKIEINADNHENQSCFYMPVTHKYNEVVLKRIGKKDVLLSSCECSDGNFDYINTYDVARSLDKLRSNEQDRQASNLKVESRLKSLFG